MKRVINLENAEERHERLELLKKQAVAIPKLLGNCVKEPIRIVIDGAYGSHPDFTFQTYELLCKRAIDIIQTQWKLSWSDVIWVSLCATWAKAIPLTLIQMGLGSKIEFLVPCESWKSVESWYYFEGELGRTLMKSMDLMQARLAETKKVKLCEIPHLSAQIRQCVQSGVGSMRKCGDFQQQRLEASRLSQYIIHFPHITPAALQTPPVQGSGPYNDAFYRQGGKLYEDKPESKRTQVNIYDEVRKSGLGGSTINL